MPENPSYKFGNSLPRIKYFFTNLTHHKAFFVILIIGSIIFFNSLFNGFIGDDFPQIIDNVSVHSISNVKFFFTGSTFYSAGSVTSSGIYYRPIMSTVFSLLYTLFGSHALPYHLFDLLIYIFNAFLVYLLFSHFFMRPTSLVLALVFLLHPINSEAVLSISSTQDVLFFFFGLLALLLIINFKSKKHLILATMLLLLSLLSKETGIVFVVLGLVYYLIFEKKFAYIPIAVSILPVLSYFILKVRAIGIIPQSLGAPIAQIDIWHRLINLPAIVFFYIRTFVFPMQLSASYQWVNTKINFPNFFLPLIVGICAIITIIYFFTLLYKNHSEKTFQIYIFFSTWFILSLLPHLQILPLDATVADRYFYLPIVGLIGMICVVVLSFEAKKKLTWLPALILILLVLFAARSFVRTFDWRSEFVLAKHDEEVSDSYALENTLSINYAEKGNYEEAKFHAEQSIQLFPYTTNYLSLGNAYVYLGDYAKAKDAYTSALNYGDYYKAYDNLAFLAVKNPRNVKEDELFIQSALLKYPEDPMLWFYLAILQYNSNQTTEAQSSIAKARVYSQRADIASVYQVIMNNQKLDLNLVP